MTLRATGVIAALASVVGVSALVGPASAQAPPQRQSRSSAVAIAGADIYVWSVHRKDTAGGGCTLSFAVRSTSAGHAWGALTAGHCVSTLAGGPSYSVHETHSGKHNTTDPGDQIGVVHAGDFHMGQYGDNAFVTADGDHRSAPEVFTGGVSSSTTIPVAGSLAVKAELSVCYSGAASGEHCGFTVVGGPRPVGFGEGHHVTTIHHEWRATSHTCPSTAGDSGSPVFTVRHGRAYAVGILSGGQTAAGKCPFYFTPVRLALHHLGLSLVTQKPTQKTR